MSSSSLLAICCICPVAGQGGHLGWVAVQGVAEAAQGAPEALRLAGLLEVEHGLSPLTAALGQRRHGPAMEQAQQPQP